MLRILRLLPLASLYLATAPILPAAEPGADDLDSASTRSRDAVEQAQRLSRDARFNRRIRREGERALSSAGQAGSNAPAGLAGIDFPEIDQQTLAKAREDIKALLSDPRLATPAGSPSDGNEPHPLVFVSFSMPEVSLRSLLVEAARVESPVVLRGLVDNSMKRTVARLGELLGTGDSSETTGEPAPEHGRAAEVRATGAQRPDPTITGAGTQRPSPQLAFGPVSRPLPSLAIDPTLFERFGVDKVPTFVLPLDTIAPCTPESCPVPTHLKVAGDVSLVYALGVMAREADSTTLGTRAEQWRERLEARP
ncbi:TrbC family F-type conjugative pilus assembly protein [Thiohalobacter sp. IOR34]|uniref:TrbC family F-type conjugative pilus assembly protein n=1 Tax=Thiohalobacter sp. IOR34 TaxID=3057176 RepID=UPI0025AFF5B3|nr:TrbC family F-type conjugative pilus assembly protein [Thiohalobacter sp. IOR34]WJW74707.1 TrbC family F-type conjugative pilus assembly protein [Thiohalobacter sp. IOR34]